MKKIILLTLFVVIAAKAEVCFVGTNRMAYSFFTYYEFEKCSAIPEKQRYVKGEKKMLATMAKYGYQQIGTFFENKNLRLLEKIGTKEPTNKIYCLALTNLRTDCEGRRVEFNCTNHPYLKMTIPYEIDLLMKHMDQKNYKLLHLLDDEAFLFVEK